MHPHVGRSQQRLSNIVRAAALEVATTEPAPPQPVPTPVRAEPVPAAESKDALALRQLLIAPGARVEELKKRRQQSTTEIAALSVELGVALAEKLLCTEIAANRQRVDRIVRQALQRLPAACAVTVCGHPDDIALLELQLKDNREMQACREGLTFRRDGALARGQLKLDAAEFFVEWDTANCLAEMHSTLQTETLTDG